MQVTFLGTTAGMPTATRMLPSVALVRGPDLFLFDCGEGTQLQLRKAGTRTGRLRHICISHLHGDHVLGLPGLLMSLALNGRRAPLGIHGPPGIERFVRENLSLLEAYVAYPLEITEREGVGEVTRGSDYRIECRPLEHRTPCLGYALVENRIPGKLDVDAARRLGVPEGPPMGRLKAGESIALASGRVVRPDEVLRPPRPGKRVAYCSDTRPCEAGALLARHADLLIHEATFGGERAEDAATKGHSTTVEAAEIAREAGALRLALTHLSPRYTDVAPLLAEAQAIFPDTVIAEDLLTLEV